VALVTGINMPNLKVLDLSQNQISQISEDFAADFRSVVIVRLTTLFLPSGLQPELKFPSP
jgi:Leucine-rich repeat (LRR) protein